MKSDRYTKFILTVIAVALVCLALQNINIITPAHANTAPPVQPLSAAPNDNGLVKKGGVYGYNVFLYDSYGYSLSESSGALRVYNVNQ